MEAGRELCRVTEPGLSMYSPFKLGAGLGAGSWRGEGRETIEIESVKLVDNSIDRIF